MTSSSFRYADFERHANRAAMHVLVDGKWLQKYDRDADPEAPAGGASSNVLDMARWMRLLLAEGRWNGRRLIDRDALLEGHTPQILSGHPSTPESRSGFYGFGTNVGYDYSGRLRLNHSGAFSQGAATQFALLPSEDLGIVVLTNGMPIGVPEAATADFLDLVVAGSIQEDWLKLYGQKLAGLYVNHSVLAGKRPPAHPKPAKSNAFYTGTYNNDFYGPIKIVAASSGLQLLIGPQSQQLSARPLGRQPVLVLPDRGERGRDHAGDVHAQRGGDARPERDARVLRRRAPRDVHPGLARPAIVSAASSEPR